ncbi:RlpA-like double-psi beta-barrel-protein domain-containing protein-containing protein [Mycotypha africana]|uniref:RlpA-like double-psi beta-barrel-protein domain-containing protein-containing protein n=1 Tax=Mycotypha africana TaxID=64632 RepID=UPI0023003A8D|nr:RlpA-like double-psi beta-barrel-protein domain-containing protein-containing protein [Mycotypha africana]KAI8988506.1 RlpA-like double-psi beta-barrel-protein domain-containing protein-containing protein [Mycotypha africana]
MFSISRNIITALIALAVCLYVSAAPAASTTNDIDLKTVESLIKPAIKNFKKKPHKKSHKKTGTYTGDGTYYNLGLGSCGWENDDDDMAAAINHEQMRNGGNPNRNPNCGRSITVHGPNGSVKVKVVDTCPACGHGDVDLSPAAFEKIADLENGRVPISWSWN